eukprot:RCo004691
MRAVVACAYTNATRKLGSILAQRCRFPRCAGLARFIHSAKPANLLLSEWDERTLSTARVMLPDDANPAGNVHGGTTLKMISEAGFVVACRHVNSTCSLNPTEHTPIIPIPA